MSARASIRVSVTVSRQRLKSFFFLLLLLLLTLLTQTVVTFLNVLKHFKFHNGMVCEELKEYQLLSHGQSDTSNA